MNDFIKSNPGLESRFNRYIRFEDYNSNQLYEIFCGLCQKNQYVLKDDAQSVLMNYFETVNSSEIGNGRGVRNVFEKIVTQQAKRIEKNSLAEGVDLQLITEEDVINSIPNSGSLTVNLEKNVNFVNADNSFVPKDKISENNYSIETLFPSESETGKLYKTLREIVLSYDPNQEEYATKLYATYRLGKKKTVSMWPKSGWIEVVLNAKIGQVQDPYGLLYDITNRKWSAAQYAFKFTSSTNLDAVEDIVNQMVNLAKQ